MTDKRLRYVCSECGVSFVTARAFREHADRTHGDLFHDERATATREWVDV